MSRGVCLVTLFSFALGLASLSAVEIEIVKLDFDLVDPPGGRDPWFQVAVTFSVERGEQSPSSNPRFADDISVRAMFATETDRGGSPSYAFYSAVAEYPTLEVGRHVAHFYLPPELVKRDRIRGEPFAYFAEVFSGDDTFDEMVSRNLEIENRLGAFIERASSDVPSALRIQEETPFAWIDPRNVPVARRRSE